MPRAQKKRGRRLKNAPYEKDEKHIKPEPIDEAKEMPADDYYDAELEAPQERGFGDQPFYGLLDAAQVEYFKEAETTMDLNLFAGPEEESQFYIAGWSEISGIELKVATDPTGSRFLERLMAHSGSVLELERLFVQFRGRVVELSMHKFASRCLETVVNCARKFVAAEVTQFPEVVANSDMDKDNTPAIHMVMEMYNEIANTLYAVAFHRFGSHVFRSLLTTLACNPLPPRSAKQSKQSQHTSLSNFHPDSLPAHPAVFERAVEYTLAKMLDGVTTEQARTAAMDPISSPVIQMVVQLEDERMQMGMLTLLFPDVVAAAAAPRDKKSNKNIKAEEKPEELDFMTISFIEKLLADETNGVGSHFLENILYTSPLSLVEYLCTSFFLPRLKIISRARGFSFAMKALAVRVGKKTATALCRGILEEVTDLSLNGIVLLSTAFAAATRYPVLAEVVTKKIETLSADKPNLLLALLNIDDISVITERPRNLLNDSVKQRALLLQGILTAPEEDSGSAELAKRITSGFLELPEERKLKFVANPVLSHVAEKIYLQRGLDAPTRRKLLNDLFGHIASSAQSVAVTTDANNADIPAAATLDDNNLACNPSASRVIDACFYTSAGLTHYRDRIAKELHAARETVMRSPYGKKVWRNWNMDLFSRARVQWQAKAPK
ncbi:armadillo-type protein [Limtongia smithiae]|uniref:armadillo-type protein n=1 Tax=Limtongia smithiae TaxID=1125753 RepID=UPI0034CF7FC2